MPNLNRVVIESDDGPFVFDVISDGSQSSKIPMGGWWGRLKSNDLLPFILKPNGEIDTGIYPDASSEEYRERLGKTSLLDGEIRVGRFVYIRIFNNKYDLPITKISEII